MMLKIALNLRAMTKFDDKAGVYVAWCPALDVRSQGDSELEAKEALQSAVRLFVKHCYKRNILDDVLNERGFTFDDQFGFGPGRGDEASDGDSIELTPVSEGSYEIDVPFHLIQQAASGRRQGDGMRWPS